MKEIVGNVFDLCIDGETDSICITTNGIVGATGLATMGAGVAGEAARRWPSVRKNLGKALKAFGNKPFVIGMINKENQFLDPIVKDISNKNYKCLVWSFPTKDDFRYNSKIDLIKQSCHLMVKAANKLDLKRIMLPRPGCSNGKLNWSDVKKEIAPILDDRFYITAFESEMKE